MIHDTDGHTNAFECTPSNMLELLSGCLMAEEYNTLLFSDERAEFEAVRASYDGTDLWMYRAEATITRAYGNRTSQINIVSVRSRLTTADAHRLLT